MDISLVDKLYHILYVNNIEIQSLFYVTMVEPMITYIFVMTTTLIFHNLYDFTKYIGKFNEILNRLDTIQGRLDRLERVNR